MKSASGRRAKFLGLVVAGLLGICLVCPIGSREQQSRTETAGARSDDWLTVNKDYSNQRYIDLDEITPSNVGNLGEVCEIQLNEPAL